MNARPFYFLLPLVFLLPIYSASGAPKSFGAREVSLVDEARLWKQTPILQQIAKKINPLSQSAGDGALGLNRKMPEKVLVEHQIEGWNWIRAGVALGNGFIVDRGIMAFEWAFARMDDGAKNAKNEGAFGESTTIEIAHFLGLYARSVLLLRSSKMNDRAKRLERLIPRLEASLRSPRSLLGEKRWDAAEKRTWVTQQRIQAAAAAYWIGQLLTNPNLKKTADIWLEDAIRRQEVSGLFPSALAAKSMKASARSQLESLEALQGLAMADKLYAMKLQDSIANGFRWFEVLKIKPAGSPVPFAIYGARTKNAFALKTAQAALRR